MEEEHESLLRTSSVIRYRSYWEHRVWIGDPKLLQELWQAERDGLVEKPEFPPFHRVRFVLEFHASQRCPRQHCSPALPALLAAHQSEAHQAVLGRAMKLKRGMDL